MNDATEQQLMRAYELIEAGNLEQAKTLLMPVLASDKNNADAWWIYAHAVSDPQTAKEALDNVLRIDRDYPGARELRDQLANQLVDRVTGTQLPPAKSPNPASSLSTPTGTSAPARAAIDDEEEDDGGFNVLRILLIAAVFVIIAVVGIVLAQNAQTPTVIVDSTSAVPTLDSGAQAADGSIPEQIVPNDSTGVLDAALVESGASPFGAGTIVSGSAASVEICNAPGAVIGRQVNSLKLALGRASAALEPAIQQLIIRVYDCVDGGGVLRTQIATDTTTADAFANGALSATEFADRWTIFTEMTPVGGSAGGS
jgi:hypothetical protein